MEDALRARLSVCEKLGKVGGEARIDDAREFAPRLDAPMLLIVAIMKDDARAVLVGDEAVLRVVTEPPGRPDGIGRRSEVARCVVTIRRKDVPSMAGRRHDGQLSNATVGRRALERDRAPDRVEELNERTVHVRENDSIAAPIAHLGENEPPPPSVDRGEHAPATVVRVERERAWRRTKKPTVRALRLRVQSGERERKLRARVIDDDGALPVDFELPSERVRPTESEADVSLARARSIATRHHQRQRAGKTDVLDGRREDLAGDDVDRVARGRRGVRVTAPRFAFVALAVPLPVLAVAVRILFVVRRPRALLPLPPFAAPRARSPAIAVTREDDHPWAHPRESAGCSVRVRCAPSTLSSFVAVRPEMIRRRRRFRRSCRLQRRRARLQPPG